MARSRTKVMTCEDVVSTKTIEAIFSEALGKEVLDRRKTPYRSNHVSSKHEIRINNPDHFYRIVKSLQVTNLTRSGYHLFFYARVGVGDGCYGDTWRIINTNGAETFIDKFGSSFSIVPFGGRAG
jgi:hypothetical protein